MHWASNRVRWGEHRGGMFVEVAGEADGGRVARAWHMVAEGDDGPFIPSMACAAIIRRCLDAKRPAPGARPATGDLELTDYETLFARRAIHCGVREETASLPLYRRLLGEAYETMPAPLQAMHDLNGDMTAEGTATVTRGRGLPRAYRRRDRRLSAGRREGAGARRFRMRERPRAMDAHLRGTRVPLDAGAGARPSSSGWCASASARSAPAWRWCSTTANCG